MFEPQNVDLPGTIVFEEKASIIIPTITAVEPVNRDELRSFIANLRITSFQGVQVPLRVIHKNPDTGEQREEHIPGCSTCNI